jgi:hypothetical protein
MVWFRRYRPKSADAGADALSGRAFRPADSVTTAMIDGQITVLDLGRDRYYGLDEVGSAIWDLVRQERTFDQIVTRLQREYDAPRPDLERDVGAFLSELRRNRLVVDA